LIFQIFNAYYPLLKQLSDIVLIDLLREQDDRSAFNELYARYWKAIYDISCKKLRDSDTAKDIVHDLFVDIWNKRGTIHITTSFAGYLFTMLSNRITDIQRKRAYQNRVEKQLMAEDEPFEDVVIQNITYHELETRLWAEVQNMPDGMRRVFLLSRNEQLSPQEIADRLSISLQTVKNQISSALKRLRTKEFHP
jgi:RNA polymerase sigma-70 factor (family 1)